MLATVRHFFSLIRFSHTVFALPFALLAAFMAWHLRAIELVEGAGPVGDELLRSSAHSGAPPATPWRLLTPSGYGFAWRWQEVVGILLCMVAARSAAMAFNRLADRELDAANPRTAARHLPAGILTSRQVVLFAVVCGLAFVASTLFFLPNRLPLFLSVPVLLFLCGYSFAKRFTPLAHFWLGAALAFSPVAAWIAIRGEQVLAHLPDLLPAAVLGGVVWTWVAGFDIIYACQDAEHDRQVQLHSIPARWGIAGALRLAAVCHLATIGCLALLPQVYPPFGLIYGIGATLAAALLAYEHALVRPDDLQRVNRAFFHVNAVISLGLLAVAITDLWWGPP